MDRKKFFEKLGLGAIFMKLGPGGAFFFSQTKNRSTAIVTDKFAFSGVSKTCSGWVFTACDPSAGTCSVSGSFATITSQTTGSQMASADGFGTNAFTAAPFNDCAGGANAVTLNSWFTTLTYNHSQVQFQISGLNSLKTYTLKFTGSTINGTAGARTTGIRVEGASLSAEQTYDPGHGSPSTPNTSSFITFTGIQPDGSGHINVFLYKTSTDRCILSAMTIANEN